jgi:hypothetical protein
LYSFILLEGRVGGSAICETFGSSFANGTIILEPKIFSI